MTSHADLIARGRSMAKWMCRDEPLRSAEIVHWSLTMEALAAALESLAAENVQILDADRRCEMEAVERAERAEAENDALRKDAETWRHIAQEQHAQLWKELRPDGADYPVAGALDALFRAYRKTGKFNQVFCSQCGKAFAHKNYHGYSHCEAHSAIDAALKEGGND